MILVSNLNSNIRNISYTDYIQLMVYHGSKVITDAQRYGKFEKLPAIMDNCRKYIIDNGLDDQYVLNRMKG